MPLVLADLAANHGGTEQHEPVHAFHAAATAAGYRDHGAPGERPQYHPGYDGTFVLDPDGHKIEVVFHDS
jgi:catechol 2,3-dioxygenase-like lactoylglutathione lyase family enzyme